jgi:hypothetical protein
MLSSARGALTRSVVVAVFATLVVAVPAFAQQDTTPPAEYGQGAGVQRARSLPRTGGGSANEGLSLEVALGAAGAVLGGTGGFLLATRRKLTARAAR